MELLPSSELAEIGTASVNRNISADMAYLIIVIVIKMTKKSV
jgi:hypothetical protein